MPPATRLEIVATLLTGTITFAEGPGPPAGATVHVRLEDVTMQDAPSVLVSQADLPYTGASSIPFQLSVPELDPRADYSLSVHVDIGDTGQVHSGDFITMESNPVTPSSLSDDCQVRVKLVR